AYDFVIAASADFTNPITVATGLTSNTYTLGLPLLPQEVYYWRVVATNICGPSPNAVFAFKTGTCASFTSTDVPKSIPLFGSPAVVTSTLNVAAIGTITDVNVVGLAGTHDEVNDLEITLKSPDSGIEVVLFSGICNDGVEDFNLSLDDAAIDSVFSCPPIAGGVFRPEGSLADFIGEDPAGTWTLTIRDNQSFNGGELTGWGLEICTSTNGNAPSLITNNPLNIDRWDQAGIGQTLLNANDPTGPANTTFTLVSLPTHGGVLLNGVNIFPGDEFTQEDVNSGALAYLHNGDSTANSDAFTFTVENPNGGWLGTPAFQINITQTVAIGPGFDMPEVQVFPNPVRELLYVKMDAPTIPSDWTVDVLTLQGQILARKQGSARQVLDASFNMAELSAGLYLVRVRTQQGQRLIKVSVR
ncbi:MAG: cadherin-like domain-containing protein, partial [Bacteroidota bacterium]